MVARFGTTKIAVQVPKLSSRVSSLRTLIWLKMQTTIRLQTFLLQSFKNCHRPPLGRTSKNCSVATWLGLQRPSLALDTSRTSF